MIIFLLYFLYKRILKKTKKKFLKKKLLGLIELTEPSDTLNYKTFFKQWILQTILQVFLLTATVLEPTTT